MQRKKTQVKKVKLDAKKLQKLSNKEMAKVVGGWGNGCWNYQH